MNLEEIVCHIPTVYERSEKLFWEDDYISKKLLEAHLDNDFEGASRNFKFTEKSVSWISQTLPAYQYPKLLDLGCGPGLYTQRFCDIGYEVTGIDISRRSIEYAIKSAQNKELNIEYINSDYIKFDIDKTYDIVTMIYCDYGALSKNERKIVMDKVYDCLSPGGIFLLDVFADKKYNSFAEIQSWEYVSKDGFWSDQSYVALQRNIKYLNLVSLEQSFILKDNTCETYNIWNTYFTKESIKSEAKSAGFSIHGMYGDIAGEEDFDKTDMICIILKKI